MMLSDWENEEKKKKIGAREKSKGKKSVAALREKMNKTISERRKEEGSSGEDSSEKFPRVKDRLAGVAAAGSTGDKAFASQKRTVDKVLSTLHESDKSVMEQLAEMDKKRWEKEEGRWQKTEAIEAEKVTLLRELLHSGGSEESRKAQKGAVEEEEVDSLKVRVGILETQGRELQEQVERQGKETTDKLDAILNVLKGN